MATEDLSFVQLKILSNFIKKTALSYTDGKPENISNDLYKYHLGFLIKKGIIEKNSNLYFLTEYGKSLVQNFSVYGIPDKLFKVSVLVYLTRENEGPKELLMQKRLRQPYFGDIETVSGKIHPGEMVETAGLRKLTEETGLSANIKFVGVIRKIRKTSENDIFEDTLYHVCFASDPKGNLVEKNEFGENFWVTIDKSYDIIKNNATYSTYSQNIITKAANNDLSSFYLVEETILKNV